MISIFLLKLVRFFVDHRIKQHASPLVKTPATSFGFQSCDRTLQVEHFTR